MGNYYFGMSEMSASLHMLLIMNTFPYTWQFLQSNDCKIAKMHAKLIITWNYRDEWQEAFNVTSFFVLLPLYMMKNDDEISNVKYSLT